MGQNKNAPAKVKSAAKKKQQQKRTSHPIEAKARAKPASAAARRSKQAAAASTAKAAAKASRPVKTPHKVAKEVRSPARATTKPAHQQQRTIAKPAVPAGATAPQPQRAMTAAIAKPAQPKISAPVTPRAASPATAAPAPQPAAQAAVAPAAPPATPKDIAVKTAEARHSVQAAKKPVNQRHGFKTNEYVVYPAHGVGRIVGIEEQEIAGMSLELFVITFDKDKMTLRVPTGKLQSVGMRKLADDTMVKRAMETLKGRARVKRTMWSRRAQEYEAKINSGDLVSIAEVVRDLYRSESQPEQSYSERQLYESALDRMAREIAAVEKLDERGAVQRITDVLAKSARGRRLAAEDGAEEGAGPDVQAA